MRSMSRSTRATLIGLLAIVFWSSIVGLIRGVSASFGATGGAALIYTLASALLLVTVGPTKVRELPRTYLIVGSIVFVAYEMCLALSIGLANTHRQAIEVGMVNYLWPAMTMVFAILFNGQKTSWLIVPGVALAIGGVCWVLGGDGGLDPHAMAANIRDNPVSYGLAFVGTLLWASYCTLTAKIAQGKNGVTLFFMLTALALWIKFFAMGGGAMRFTPQSMTYLALAAAAMGFGYAAWNAGILHGNMTVLAGASYFIPVLSAALAALVLSTPLSIAFWQGAAMVCLGSILCWLATRR